MYLKDKAEIDAAKKAKKLRKSEQEQNEKGSFATFDNYLANLSKRNCQPTSLFDRPETLEHNTGKQVTDGFNPELIEQGRREADDNEMADMKGWTGPKEKSHSEDRDKKDYQVLKSLFKKLQHP